MAPTYLSDCLPTTIGETVTYNLRNNDDYIKATTSMS
jgi:hypothetical protein